MRKLRNLIQFVTMCLLSFFIFLFNTMTAFAYVTIATEIPVTCLDIPDGETHTYKIIIESENDISPVPKSDTLKITESGTGKFEIDIDEPGTFVYKIYEQPGNEPDIIYDDSVYIVTVFVENFSDNDLKYAVSATAMGDGDKPKQISFKNNIQGLPDSQKSLVTTDETISLSTNTDSLNNTSSKDSASTSLTVTTTSTSAFANNQSSSNNTKNQVEELIDSVLTGDTFPAHIVRIIMLSSVLIAVSTFFFKRDNSENENKNEE